MAVENSLVRQWTVLRTLASRGEGATVKEIAAEMGVCEKTIRRDLATFATSGFPLKQTILAHGRKAWRLDLGNGRPELHFAFDEALALFLGRRFLEPLAGTYLWEAAQQAFKKVRACLGRPALAYLEKMAGNLHNTTVGAGDYSSKAQIVDDLLRGIEDRRQTIISYQSLRATEPVEYAIDPLGIVYHRGSLYVVAFSHDHGEVRHFKVDRIDEIEVGKLPFQKPDDFDLQEHLRGSFGIFHGTGDVAVKVRFLPSVARYVLEGRWHASQKLTRQRDGSVLAEFRLSTTEEIVHSIRISVICTGSVRGSATSKSVGHAVVSRSMSAMFPTPWSQTSSPTAKQSRCSSGSARRTRRLVQSRFLARLEWRRLRRERDRGNCKSFM